MSGALESQPGTSGEQVTEPLLEDRRLVSRVLKHWNEMATGQQFPSKSQIDPWLVGDDWASCTLINIHQPLGQSTFLVVGDKLLPSPGRSLDGRRIADCPSDTLLGITLSFLSRVVATGRALTLGGTATHLDEPILYRSVLLPLAEDGRRIDGVLCAANYRRLRAGELTEQDTSLDWGAEHKPPST